MSDSVNGPDSGSAAAVARAGYRDFQVTSHAGKVTDWEADSLRPGR